MYIGDEISRLSRLVIEIPIFGYLEVWGFWGYLATSDAKSDVIFLLGDPDFLLGNEISRLSRLVIEIPILRYLWVLWVFGGIWLLPVKNLASYSCSPTPISY